MTLDPDRRRAALGDLPDWRYSMRAFHTAYEAGRAAEAIELLHRVSAIAADHAERVCLDWRNRHVFVRVRDDRADGVEEVDLELAARISAAAEGVATARPELCRVIELAIDTDTPQRLSATWAAALGYEKDAQGNLWDPYRRGPDLWFQQTETPAQSRFHIDITVPDDQGDGVLDEVASAGGRRIDERFQPAFTVLADADDNRLCICTQLGRD
jgi:4a-hydroxytetrahydrobiopterin dehydratase